MSGTTLERLQARSLRARDDARRRNARSYLDYLDRAYGALRAEHVAYDGLMRRPANDGRPPVAYSVVETVNGAEVRASDRWRETPVSARPAHWRDAGTRIVGLPAWLTMALDTATIARHFPLHVEPLGDDDATGAETRATGTRRAPKVSAADERAARLRAAVTAASTGAARRHDAEVGATT